MNRANFHSKTPSGEFVRFDCHPMSPLLMIVGIGLLGFLTGSAKTAVRTLIQERMQEIAPSKLGIVMGLYMAISALADVFGTLMVGYLTGWLDPTFPALFFWMAPFFLLGGLLFLFAPYLLKNGPGRGWGHPLRKLFHTIRGI